KAPSHATGLRRGVIPLLLSGNDTDYMFPSGSFCAERYFPSSLREQGVIPADPDVVAGVDTGSTLAHDDFACAHQLSAKPFDPEPLGLGVSAIAGAAACFFMC